VPSDPATVVQLELDVAGTQAWQESEGLRVSGVTTPPSMKQSARQLPEAQSRPLPQGVPSAAEDQREVDCDGSHERQGIDGSSCPAL
jgi:hypothetical protein